MREVGDPRCDKLSLVSLAAESYGIAIHSDSEHKCAAIDQFSSPSKHYPTLDDTIAELRLVHEDHGRDDLQEHAPMGQHQISIARGVLCSSPIERRPNPSVVPSLRIS